MYNMASDVCKYLQSERTAVLKRRFLHGTQKHKEQTRTRARPRFYLGESSLVLDLVGFDGGDVQGTLHLLKI